MKTHMVIALHARLCCSQKEKFCSHASDEDESIMNGEYAYISTQAIICPVIYLTSYINADKFMCDGILYCLYLFVIRRIYSI